MELLPLALRKSYHNKNLDPFFMNFTQIISFHSFSLFFKRYTARQFYGKPPTLLRDSGSKNPHFFSKSAFFIKKKDDLIRSHRSWYIHIFLSNQPFLEKKNSKNFETNPSSKFAKNGQTEPLRDSGSKNPHFFSKSAFFIKKKDDLIRSHRSWYIHIFLSNQPFLEKKNSKNFETNPSSKFAKNGQTEPLWSRGFSVLLLRALLPRAFCIKI